MRNSLSTVLLGTLLAAGLHAVLPESEFLWLGGSSTPHWSHPGNWHQGVPPDAANAQVFLDNDLGFNTVTYVHLDGSRAVGRLFLRGNVALTGDAGSVLSVHQGIEVQGDYYYYAESSLNGQYPFFAVAGVSDQVTLALAEANTWRTDYHTILNVRASLVGSADLTIEGDGQVNIRGSSPAYTGTVTLQRGRLGLAGGDALGTGALVFGPNTDSGTMFVPDGEGDDGVVTVDNPLVIHDTLRVGYNPHSESGDLEFSNVVTLMGDVILRLDDTPVFFSGSIVEEGGPAHITIDSPTAAAIFAGNSSFTGGLHAAQGAAVFLSGNALPAQGAFSSESMGYIGLADPTTPMAGFVARFNPATTTGSIGFDTNPTQFKIPHNFTEAIDLTGFNSNVRLGSISSAILSGTITPVSTEADYRFGTGGGTLYVQSLLTGNRGITVESPSTSPLMVRITNPGNTFTGNVTMSHSGISFAPGALPADTLFNFSNEASYVGTSDPTTVPAFLGRFPAGLEVGMIGFDDGIVVHDLDLSRFTSQSSGLFVATSSAAELTGNLIPSGTLLNFTGYRGGELTVSANLTGSRFVYVGMPHTRLAHEHDGMLSTVRLSGDNTYTGGTALQAGRLVLDSASPLGTGFITVQGFYDQVRYEQVRPELQVIYPGGITLANPIQVYGPWRIDLQEDLTLTGNLDVFGETEIFGRPDATLTLSGAHGYSEHWRLRSGNLAITQNMNYFGRVVFQPDAPASLTFTSDTPLVQGLHTAGNHPLANVHLAPATATPVTLTISHGYQGNYFGGTISGTGSLRITGDGFSPSSFGHAPPAQILAGQVDLTGGITVENGGRLILDQTTTLANNARLLTIGVAGELVLDNPANLAADIVFAGAYGRLSGQGMITPINGPGSAPLLVQDFNTLAPGRSIGSLQLNHAVVFGPSGVLEFELADGPGGGLIHDSLLLHSLNVTATPQDRFEIRLGAVNYWLENFNPHAHQTWTVLSTVEALPTLDLDSFHVGLGYSFDYIYLHDGSFGLAQVGNSLNLTFTPIPEPSTAVLLLLGLGLLAAYRPRRRT
jgi:fibronectin-binding autotransporter adhesin